MKNYLFVFLIAAACSTTSVQAVSPHPGVPTTDLGTFGATLLQLEQDLEQTLTQAATYLTLLDSYQQQILDATINNETLVRITSLAKRAQETFNWYNDQVKDIKRRISAVENMIDSYSDLEEMSLVDCALECLDKLDNLNEDSIKAKGMVYKTLGMTANEQQKQLDKDMKHNQKLIDKAGSATGRNEHLAQISSLLSAQLQESAKLRQLYIADMTAKATKERMENMRAAKAHYQQQRFYGTSESERVDK